MKGWTRRRVLSAVGAGAAVAALPVRAANPFMFVVPAPPGGGLDFIARTVARQFSELRGQPALVENRAGASTNIGMEHVIRSPADGNTVLIAGMSTVINDLLFKLSFNPRKDLRPVIHLAQDVAVLAVPADSPIQGAGDLVRVARAKKGGLNCGGAAGYMSIACRQLGTFVDLELISFSGVGPAVNALLGGHIDMAFVSPEIALRPHAEAGRIRYIAVSDALRNTAPVGQVPGFRQLWPDFVAYGVLGAWVPAATPTPVVEKLNRDLNTILAMPEVRDTLHAGGVPIVGGTVAAFEEYLRRARDDYTRVIARLKIEPQ